MTTKTIVVTDETTRAEIAEALAHLNHDAKRAPHVFGVTAPSRWDIAHARLDALLEDYDRAPA